MSKRIEFPPPRYVIYSWSLDESVPLTQRSVYVSSCETLEEAVEELPFWRDDLRARPGYAKNRELRIVMLTEEDVTPEEEFGKPIR